MKCLRKHLWQFLNLTNLIVTMNKSIIFSKSGYVETRNFETSPLPVWINPHMTKRKDTIFLVNKHTDTELLFVTDGSMKIHLNNDTFVANSGDVVVINPNVLHNIMPLTDYVTYHCFIIDKNFFKSHYFPIDQVHIKEVITDDTLFETCEQIIQLSQHQDDLPYSVAKIHNGLLGMVIYLFENYGGEKPQNETTKNALHTVEMGIKYINKNFKKTISLSDIAKHTGYSKFHFCRLFKETTGYTVATYINMQRVKYAQQLLETSELSVCEIAFECGFKSVSYFSTTYKKYTGNSPSIR